MLRQGIALVVNQPGFEFETGNVAALAEPGRGELLGQEFRFLVQAEPEDAEVLGVEMTARNLVAHGASLKQWFGYGGRAVSPAAQARAWR